MINCANLIEGDLAALTREKTSHAGWISLLRCCHWRDDGGPQMAVGFVRLNYNTGVRLANLTANSRIERDEVDAESLGYHVHSV